MDPYIVNALAHLNFVALHPFSDGNGRVARVLCSLLMMRDGYRAQAFYSLEEYFGVNWREYGTQIESVLGPRWDPGRLDCTTWVEWYLDAVAIQVSQAEQSLRRAIATLVVVYGGFAVDNFPLGRQALAVWLAVRDGQVTNRTYRLGTAVSHKTASEELRSLTDAGYLAATGRGRGVKYLLGDRVKAWGEYSRLAEIAEQRGFDGVVEDIKQLREGRPGLF
jgi:Fic family protein